jgi:methylase of polypeptide subunit release factors
LEPFAWRTESDDPAPTAVTVVDDRLSADAALAKVKRGEVLLHTGDFHNAKQLLSAMARRLERKSQERTAAEAFKAERRARQLEHRTVGQVLVELDAQYRLKLGRAPDVRVACEQVWGPPPKERTLVPLKTLLGMMGAAQWRKTGIQVPGLHDVIRPHYGVYTPTRTDYLDLLAVLREVKGKTVIELGAGTGVLSFVLLQKGAKSVVATDVEPRAVVCARENAKALGFEKRFEVQERSGYPEGKADLVVCNPPWIPEAPKNRVDRAVFDEGSAFLLEFLEGLSAHLNEGGRGVLLISNLAELLGLREEGWLEAQFERCGLAVELQTKAKPRHDKAKDKGDRLHEARSKEITSLYVLSSKSIS